VHAPQVPPPEPLEDPLDDPLDEPLEDPLDEPLDDPLEEPLDEPLELPELLPLELPELLLLKPELPPSGSKPVPFDESPDPQAAMRPVDRTKAPSVCSDRNLMTPAFLCGRRPRGNALAF
jgi:hypothetical protein